MAVVDALQLKMEKSNSDKKNIVWKTMSDLKCFESHSDDTVRYGIQITNEELNPY